MWSVMEYSPLIWNTIPQFHFMKSYLSFILCFFFLIYNRVLTKCTDMYLTKWTYKDSANKSIILDGKHYSECCGPMEDAFVPS